MKERTKKTMGVALGSIAGASIIIPVIFACLLAIPTIVLFLFSLSIPADPKPQITYGEFPFTVQYKLDGKTMFITDTVVCEFDGFYRGELGRKRRSWDSYLKSGNEFISLYQTEDIEILISLNLGSSLAEIYMGDPNSIHDEPYKTLGYREIIDGKRGEFDFISEKDMWEKYKLKLIHIKFSDPIENSFD